MGAGKNGNEIPGTSQVQGARDSYSIGTLDSAAGKSFANGQEFSKYIGQSPYGSNMQDKAAFERRAKEQQQLKKLSVMADLWHKASQLQAGKVIYPESPEAKNFAKGSPGKMLDQWATFDAEVHKHAEGLGDHKAFDRFFSKNGVLYDPKKDPQAKYFKGILNSKTPATGADYRSYGQVKNDEMKQLLKSAGPPMAFEKPDVKKYRE